MKTHALLASLGALSLALAAPASRAEPPAPPGASSWKSAPPSATAEAPTCLERITDDEALEQVLTSFTVQLGESRKPIKELHLVGLHTLSPDTLGELLGDPPDKPDAASAALVLRRLARSGLFERVTPVLVARDDAVVLEIDVLEHPTVKQVVFEGLSELKPERLLEALLETPSPGEVERRRPDARRSAKAARRRPPKICPDPLPPPAWLARAEGEVVYPGVVWKGLRRGFERLAGRIQDLGYAMASLGAELRPDGTLVVRVDEGHIAAVELRGVEPAVAPQVLRLLDLPPGRTFVRSELEGGMDRVRAALPFLRTDRAARVPATERQVIEERGEGGVLRYRVTEVASEEPERQSWFTIEDRRLVLHLRARRTDLDVFAEELLHHAPVTGFAPGLELSATLWDPGNRAHLTVDLGGNVNQHRARAAATPQDPDPDRWRFDGLVGPRVTVPRLSIAEAGVQLYTLVDTTDRWRLDRLDSYLDSMVLNRPGSDYFRRKGLSGFVTALLGRHALAGVEYRRDRYRSLVSQPEVFTVFNNDEPPPATPPITEGTMGSLILRLEWSTFSFSPFRVGKLRRDPERTIVRLRRGEDWPTSYWWTELRTVTTLEIANPSLGGDDRFRFVRLVSDNAAVLRTGHEQGLKVRLRAAGKVGGEALPLQKQEALGGWSDLRGYDFKEFRDGTFSLLGTAEYRLEVISAFIDVGSVRVGDEFGTPKVGLGLALNLGDDVHLDVAWRADDDARLRPEVRLLFGRTF
jgi:hypothetical protein